MRRDREREREMEGSCLLSLVHLQQFHILNILFVTLNYTCYLSNICKVAAAASA